jgi:ribosome-associated toxin RatA of RatAB toxin-antitoxin module
MRSVKVVIKTKASPNTFWNLITDVSNWNNLIKFVREIKLLGDVKEGTKFYDITTIFIIPVIIHHKITKIENYRKFYMEADLPMQTGRMYQNIDNQAKDKYCEITIEIKFKINFFLFDFIFGPILEARLRDMIVSTLEKLKKDNIEYKDAEIIK